MTNSNIVAATERDNYQIIETVRAAGAVLTGVSGYGSGYYIQIEATQAQADYINRYLYTEDIHNMSAAQVTQAWHAGDLTVNQVIEWQTRHAVVLEVNAV